MEADFNFANKLFFGKQMMEWAEDHDEFPDECFGSRKGRSAINAAINRELSLDLMRQKQTPGTIIAVDAMQCYDQMAHSIVSMLAQCLTMMIEVIVCLLLMIQLMKFFLCTAFGNSSSHYGGQRGIPYQGICQGNGGEPGMWLAVSIILVKILCVKGHVAIFV